MRYLTSAVLTVLAGAGLVAGVAAPAVAATATATAVSPAAAATFADITCGPSSIQIRAWGNGYPANTGITVNETVSVNGSPNRTVVAPLTTSASGNWATPVSNLSTTARGRYDLRVVVTSNGVQLGSASDSCTL